MYLHYISATFFKNSVSRYVNTNENFDANSSVLSGNPTHFSLPTTEGYYKISVDLKEGITISEGEPSIVTPNGSSKFTLRYTLQ
mgnify:CR=1 FL=1